MEKKYFHLLNIKPEYCKEMSQLWIHKMGNTCLCKTLVSSCVSQKRTFSRSKQHQKTLFFPLLLLCTLHLNFFQCSCYVYSFAMVIANENAWHRTPQYNLSKITFLKKIHFLRTGTKRMLYFSHMGNIHKFWKWKDNEDHLVTSSIMWQ